MQIKFYTLGDKMAPSMTVGIYGSDIWSRMCEYLVDHVLGEDPHSGVAAEDIVEVVAMESTDGEEYVEAVYIKGELVGSIDAPFWYPINEYVKI